MNKCNESFFENINTEAKAYFLGLMYADGCICEQKIGQNRININLKYHDKHILETFKKHLEYTGKLTFTENSKKKLKFNIQDQYRLRISSNKLCNDLSKHGCTPRKTFTLKFPTTVPEHLLRHFIRGLFDGDGGVYSKIKGRNKFTPIFRFQITGTYNICEGINQLFFKLFNFKPLKLTFHKNSYTYALGGSYQIKQIFHYLYDNSNPELCLIRKYNIFKQILNYENKPIIKISKYKHITYRKQLINPWCIIKWNNRKCKITGMFSNEFDAYIALCKDEEQNNISFSNDPTEYFNYNLSSKN